MTGTFLVTSQGSLRLRAQPDSETGDVVGSLPSGTRVERVSGAPGDIWFKVRAPRLLGALEGWAASRWLMPVDASAADQSLWDTRGKLYQLVWNGPLSEAPIEMRRCIDGIAPHFDSALSFADISTPLQRAHFFAQCSVESASFCKFEEDLYYNAPRLPEVFSHFKSKVLGGQGMDTAPYAHNPKALASLVYANKNGNGGEDTGDGYTYRGRGILQLTGRSNYRQRGEELGVGSLLEETPDKLFEPEWALKSAAAYWKAADCNKYADEGLTAAAVRRVSQAVNTGFRKRRGQYVEPNHLPERMRATQRAARIWALAVEQV